MKTNALKSKINSCIVVPCYNEEKELAIDKYCHFLRKTPEVMLCFVNDGSSDNTLEVLKKLQNKYPDKVTLVSYPENIGKAAAVRKGILHCNNSFNHSYIGYLDADLSASLEECIGLESYLDDKIYFAFGSRIMKIGSTIVRNRYRFVVGRVIATFISNILGLMVYDTQCGCKLFTKELSEQLFERSFISKWLFDVEIFYRMIHLYGKKQVLERMMEVPLKKWIDDGNSKVKASYFFKLWIDLYLINRKYKSSSIENSYSPQTVKQND